MKSQLEDSIKSLAISQRNWKLALVDIDGTLCRDAEPIAGAAAFINRLRSNGIQPVFFTNNSTRTPKQVIDVLRNVGIEGTVDEVCTSAQATAKYIADTQEAGAVVCYLGESGLEEAMRAEGLVPISPKLDRFDEQSSELTAAVIGLDKDVHYQHLARFCRVVYRLQSFILTNPDVRLPVPGGFLPGSGALGAFVERVTGVTPIVIGKPQATFVEFALTRYHATSETTFIVGDNLFTDIAAANRAGVYSIHVQTGILQHPVGACSGRHVQTVAYPSPGDLPIPNETCASVAELFV